MASPRWPRKTPRWRRHPSQLCPRLASPRSGSLDPCSCVSSRAGISWVSAETTVAARERWREPSDDGCSVHRGAANPPVRARSSDIAGLSRAKGAGGVWNGRAVAIVDTQHRVLLRNQVEIRHWGFDQAKGPSSGALADAVSRCSPGCARRRQRGAGDHAAAERQLRRSLPVQPGQQPGTRHLCHEVMAGLCSARASRRR